MGRHRLRIEETDEDYDWPFDISIKVKRTRPKIAFLSGCIREYYPDDPGFSKFGQEYRFPDPEDTVKCTYFPEDGDRLNKPISNLGYGIGGLSAFPRFPRNRTSENPAPNAYQSHLVPPRVQRSQKVEKIKWRDFVEKYERIAIAEELNAQKESEKGRSSKFSVLRNSQLTPDLQPKSYGVQSEIEFRDTGRHCPTYGRSSAFGLSLERPRFEKGAMAKNPGAGTYDPTRVLKKQSFQITTGEGVLIPRVRLVCLPGSCDTCMNCGIDLFQSDYYQTKEKYKVKNTADVRDVAKYKMTHLSLCRDCYCHAIKHGHAPWKKASIPQLFMKARHCNSVHDHQQGQPEYLTRATCKGIQNLARREIRFSRYFKDNPCKLTT